MLLPEGGLQRMQLLGAANPFDRGDRLAPGLEGEHGTALDRVPVDEDGACAALARVAADVGAREVEVVTKDLDQQGARLDLDCMRRAIVRQSDGTLHCSRYPCGRRAEH